MADIDDLLAQVAQLKQDGVSTKASLDAIKTGVGTIVAGLPPTGGIDATGVAQLKAALADVITDADANTAEAGADAAAVAAAQPAAPAPTA